MPKILTMAATRCALLLMSFFLIGFSSCHSYSSGHVELQHDLSKIRTGMSFVEVLQVAGAPDTIYHVGVYLDSMFNQTKTDEWHYGNNQIVVIVNDTVNAIDLNAEATQRRIQHIIDSARAADGNNTPFIQPSSQ